jgi:hypothetical protein
MQAEAQIWVGRCLDLMNRHADAVPYYERAGKIDATPVSDAARRHIHAPFTKKGLAHVEPEFIVATALAKY